MSVKWVDSLPDNLRIGPFDVRVEKVAKIGKPDIDGSVTFGVYIDQTHSLQIKRSQRTKEMVVETVLHEIMHALWQHGSLPDKGEERIVSILGVGLTQVLRDNPKFTKWLYEMNEKKE